MYIYAKLTSITPYGHQNLNNFHSSNQYYKGKILFLHLAQNY